MFNNLFDALNSQRFSAVNFKNPISNQTKETHFELFDNAEKYIMGLQIDEYKTPQF